MKILVVDNGGQWTHREWRMLRYLNIETEIIPNTTPVEKIHADGLILSGGAPRISTDIPKLGNTADYLEEEIPVLALCVAHQFLAIYFGGKAGPAKVPEYGKTEITITKKDDIFKDIPEKIVVWESHNDEITLLPSCFEPLAHSEYCAFQAIKHKEKPFYGLQFHPEVEDTQFGEKMFKNFADVVKEKI
ncbi:MAG TPA: GMP synthase subunit A [Thermoplasmata archaeon]|nr:GMP synthase subunit A [Thermoplasmata archaeon]